MNKNNLIYNKKIQNYKFKNLNILLQKIHLY